MDASVLSSRVIDILKKHLSKNRSRAKRPIFIFSCGGNPENHPAREILKSYIEDNRSDQFKNVFIFNAEDIAEEPDMAKFDLLTQEALVADIADWLVIFAESVGSFCELGAFAAMPHSVAITSVIIDKKHKNDNSFLIKGPVRVIRESKAPLADVFYSNLQCPMANAKFTDVVNNIRENVIESELFESNKRRKKLSDSGDPEVMVGSFAHELLDLITLFGPIDENTLIKLYVSVKEINRKDLSLRSLTLGDMNRDQKVKPQQVLATMHAANLIGIVSDKNEIPLYYSKINLESYFMFKDTDKRDFNEMRAEVLLYRRRNEFPYEANFYQRFNSR